MGLAGTSLGSVCPSQSRSRTNDDIVYDTATQSDYRPLVEFARAQCLPVLAANPPRREVSCRTCRLARIGWPALSNLSALLYK
ncbi:ChaN family lipoprotein [Chloracidobacterium sp. MS 40/45]|nr:ChaN family lipoprotein [Chloracidobacterium sp. MS 40/45]